MNASPTESAGQAGPAGYILWAGTVGFSSPLAERFAAGTEALWPLAVVVASRRFTEHPYPRPPREIVGFSPD